MSESTVYLCESCGKVTACINVQTTHLILCRVIDNTCPCVKTTDWGVKLSSCDIRDNVEKYNHLYLEPRGLCKTCFMKWFETNLV